MQTKSLLKKGLVVGIIVLLETSILPLVTCVPTENHHSIGCSSTTLNRLDDVVNWTINGTMGRNGWYISPLNFSCTYDHNVVAAVYYSCTGVNGTLYTQPFTVYTEGEIYFYWWWVDYQGNVFGPHGPYYFKVDYTPPVFIDWTVTRLNLLGTKWLLNATLSDPISGVEWVDFYVDNQSVSGNATSPNSDGSWSFVYQGKGKVAQAIACDFAGNRATSSSLTMPLIFQQSHSCPSIVRKTMLLHNLIYNLIILHQNKGWNQ